MFGLSASHIIILAIVMLLFGARRLPEVGAGLGKGLRAFKSALEGQDVFDEKNQRNSLAAQQNRDELPSGKAQAGAQESGEAQTSQSQSQSNKA